MKKTIGYDLDEAVWVRSYLNDFDGDVAAWKNAFYELWRWHLTFDFAYEIKIDESRQNGVFVWMIISPVHKENVTGLMEDLGFRNIKTEACKIVSIDNDFGDNVWHVELE